MHRISLIYKFIYILYKRIYFQYKDIESRERKRRGRMCVVCERKRAEDDERRRERARQLEGESRSKIEEGEARVGKT